MGFESLLGNERLKENLTGSLRRGRVSIFICFPARKAPESTRWPTCWPRRFCAGETTAPAAAANRAARCWITATRTLSPWTTRKKRPFPWI